MSSRNIVQNYEKITQNGLPQRLSAWDMHSLPLVIRQARDYLLSKSLHSVCIALLLGPHSTGRIPSLVSTNEIWLSSLKVRHFTDGDSDLINFAKIKIK